VYDAGSVQIGQCPEQRGHGRDGLAGSELSSGAKKLGQTAAVDLIQDQCERAVGHGDGAVPTDQMVVLDPVVNGHLLSRQHLRLRHISHRDNLENETATIQVANRDPLGAGRAHAHSARGDETWHERRHRDSSPYALNTSLTRSTMP